MVGFLRTLTWLNALEGYGIRAPPPATEQDPSSSSS